MDDATRSFPLTVQSEDGIVEFVLSRPQKANALNIELILALTDALGQAEDSLGVRAVIISGQGRNFCAGADLSQLLEGGPRAVRAIMEPLRSLMRALEYSRLPIVAAVHGAARAGGLELALACDVIVASRSATFGDAHIANNLFPAGGATVRLARTVGWHRAKWLILSGSAISAPMAKDWGLVQEITDEDCLLPSARQMATELGSADADTFSQAKRLLAGTQELSFSAALEAEIAALEKHASAESFRNGIAAFLKR